MFNEKYFIPKLITRNSFNSQGVQFATLKTQFESKVNSLENQLTDANASKKKYHEALENLQKDNESLFSSTTKQINQMMADYELRLQQNSEAKYGMPELFEKLDETSKKNIQEIFKLQVMNKFRVLSALVTPSCSWY